METMTEREFTPVRWWSGTVDELESQAAELEVEKGDNPNEIALHTFAVEQREQYTHGDSAEVRITDTGRLALDD